MSARGHAWTALEEGTGTRAQVERAVVRDYAQHVEEALQHLEQVARDADMPTAVFAYLMAASQVRELAGGWMEDR